MNHFKINTLCLDKRPWDTWTISFVVPLMTFLFMQIYVYLYYVFSFYLILCDFLKTVTFFPPPHQCRRDSSLYKYEKKAPLIFIHVLFILLKTARINMNMNSMSTLMCFFIPWGKHKVIFFFAFLSYNKYVRLLF